MFLKIAMRAETHEERLLNFLFEQQGYRSVARAVMDTSKTVTVSIDFVLLRIHGLVSIHAFRCRSKHRCHSGLVRKPHHAIQFCVAFVWNNCADGLRIYHNCHPAI